MATERYTPSWRRLLMAFVLAPLVASGAPFALATLAVFLVDPIAFVHTRQESIIGDTMFIALVGAYPMTLVFGVPLFVLVKPFARWLGYGPWTPMLVGFATVFAGTWGLQAMDHVVHADGYLFAAETAIDGAFGGFVFWLVAVGLDPRWRASRRRQPVVIFCEGGPIGTFDSLATRSINVHALSQCFAPSDVRGGGSRTQATLHLPHGWRSGFLRGRFHRSTSSHERGRGRAAHDGRRGSTKLRGCMRKPAARPPSRFAALFERKLTPGVFFLFFVALAVMCAAAAGIGWVSHQMRAHVETRR